MISRNEKHVKLLKEPTRRALAGVIAKLEQTQKILKSKADKLASGKEKDHLLFKLGRISKGLKAVKELSEEDVINFALSTHDNLMALAVKKRAALLDRLKAQVASNKPLRLHLARVKKQLQQGQEQDSSEKEEEEEGEPPEDSNKKLDKMTVNNLIVKLRNPVKRTKVNITHKLTRRLKKLRDYKGDGKLKKKCERQAERLATKLSYILKLEPDEVSRFAITNVLDLKQLTVDIKVPARIQALATLASHKFVSDHVKHFKTANPNCEDAVSNILMKKKKKRKLLVGKQVYSTSKSKSIDQTDETVSDMEDGENPNDMSDSFQEQSDTEEESNLERKVNKIQKVNKSLINSDVDASDDEDESSDYETENTFENRSDEAEGNECLEPHNTESMSPEREENIVIKQNKTATSKQCKIAKEKENKPKVVDPFFMTTSNEEYVTSQVPVVTEIEQANFNCSKRDTFFTKPYNTDTFDKNPRWNKREKERPNSFHNQPYQKFTKHTERSFEKVPNSLPQKPIIDTRNRKERRKALQSEVQKKTVEKLHPSWEAKKKQSSIASFQGKKITFD